MSEERVRLFVALELPSPVRAALWSWGGAVAANEPRLRRLAREALHVTLCFLGWRDSSEVSEIAEACGRSAGAGVAPLALGDGIWLPPRRPRVLAVELNDESGKLDASQAELARALSDGGWYTPESRPFLPHVTVCRVVTRARVRPIELPPVAAIGFEGSTVTLYRSRLGSGGARYESLRRVEL